MLPLLTTRGAVMAFSITNRQNAFELEFVSGVARVWDYRNSILSLPLDGTLCFPIDELVPISCFC